MALPRALNITPNGRNYFEQLELRDPLGRSQTFLVSTERFEREFRMSAMVPVYYMSVAHGHTTRRGPVTATCSGTRLGYHEAQGHAAVACCHC